MQTERQPTDETGIYEATRRTNNLPATQPCACALDGWLRMSHQKSSRQRTEQSNGRSLTRSALLGLTHLRSHGPNSPQGPEQGAQECVQAGSRCMQLLTEWGLRR